MGIQKIDSFFWTWYAYSPCFGKMGLCNSVALYCATYDNTKTFDFKGLVCKAKVVRVYDGDTCWVVMPVSGTLRKIKVRLLGIDTPEIHPDLKTPQRDKMIEKAFKAKKALEDMVLDKVVRLECGEFDKYGRLLVTILYKGENVNTYLIENAYAKAYYGGHKDW